MTWHSHGLASEPGSGSNVTSCAITWRQHGGANQFVVDPGKDDVECCRNDRIIEIFFFHVALISVRVKECQSIRESTEQQIRNYVYCTGEHPIGIIETPLEQTAEAWTRVRRPSNSTSEIYPREKTSQKAVCITRDYWYWNPAAFRLDQSTWLEIQVNLQVVPDFTLCRIFSNPPVVRYYLPSKALSTVLNFEKETHPNYQVTEKNTCTLAVHLAVATSHHFVSTFFAVTNRTALFTKRLEVFPRYSWTRFLIEWEKRKDHVIYLSVVCLFAIST